MTPTCTRPDDARLACLTCHGAAFDPAEEGDLVPCLACAGSGYAMAEGDLGATRSEPKRPFRFNPATKTLTLWKGKKATSYTVGEFTPDVAAGDPPARAFQLVKHDTAEVYSCLVSSGHGSTCDCAGQSYAGSARANQRAHETGGPIYGGLGCKHLDALWRLLADGWLDLPEAVPPFSVPMSESVAG